MRHCHGRPFLKQGDFVQATSDTTALKTVIADYLDRVIRDAANNDTQAAWGLLNRITQDEVVSWDMLRQITRTINLRWPVIAALYHMTGDMDARWDVVRAVQESRQSGWDLLNRLTKSSVLSWHLLKAMTHGIDVPGEIAVTLGETSRMPPVGCTPRHELEQRIGALLANQGGLLFAITGDAAITQDISSRLAKLIKSRRPVAQESWRLEWRGMVIREQNCLLTWFADGAELPAICVKVTALDEALI